MAAFDYLGIKRADFGMYEYYQLVQHIGCILQNVGFLTAFDDFSPYVRTMSRKLMLAKYRYFEANGITADCFNIGRSGGRKK